MWILVHHSLKAAREDPIVSPGQLSSHAHSFVGANGVSATTTTASSLEEASTCTTAGLTADMSAYWAPSLYSYNADNDTFTPRPLDYVNTYYLGRGSAPLVAFPRGLQMLAGNATRRGAGPTQQADDAVSFVCLNYADGSSQSPTLPGRSCPQGLRTQVIFPSCWNGQDLVSKNHSHVVYPRGDISQGSCPDSNPIRLAHAVLRYSTAGARRVPRCAVQRSRVVSAAGKDAGSQKVAGVQRAVERGDEWQHQVAARLQCRLERSPCGQRAGGRMRRQQAHAQACQLACEQQHLDGDIGGDIGSDIGSDIDVDGANTEADPGCRRSSEPERKDERNPQSAAQANLQVEAQTKAKPKASQKAKEQETEQKAARQVPNAQTQEPALEPRAAATSMFSIGCSGGGAERSIAGGATASKGPLELFDFAAAAGGAKQQKCMHVSRLHFTHVS
ncbi:hypothetical protein L1887_46117 [Cichorium endivia]|nr:hypothetical protein L1887_46117 [Cichorium endivia]